MRTLNRILPLVAVIVAAPTLAHAQAEQVPPEVMLLVDTSLPMERTLEGVPPVCAPRPNAFPIGGNPPALQYTESRLALVKGLLAGRPKHINWCVEEDRVAQNYDLCADDRQDAFGRQAQPHFRYMCAHEPAVNGLPSTWSPCANDHGKAAAAADDASSLPVTDTLNIQQALIYNNLTDIKFGLATADTMPESAGACDTWSYGNDQLAFAGSMNAIAPLVGKDVDRGFAGAIAKGVLAADLNLGIRSPDAKFGPLISGHRGDASDNQVVIGDDAGDVDQIAAHNRYVASEIRRLVGYGWSPISPMLHDLEQYYDAQAAAGGDPNADCRRRFVLLMSHGESSRYYGGQACNAVKDCGPGAIACAQHDPANPVRVCYYQDGYPYGLAVEAASRLWDRGIPVFVIGLSPNNNEATDYLKQIAEAGSPGMGPNGRAGYFDGSDPASIQDALNRVRNAALAGNRARTRVVVTNPTLADGIDVNDENRVRQWRVGAYTEVPGGSDDASYGRVTITEMSCRDVDNGGGKRALTATGFRRAHDVLADRPAAAPRRSFSRRRGNDPLVVVGGEDQMFSADGTPTTPNDQGDASLMLACLEAIGDPQPGDPLVDLPSDEEIQRAGLLFNGYFGEQGLPDGVGGDLGRRQLGSVLAPNMVAIQRPVLGLTTPAALKFERDYKNRPTLLAVGANDAALHIFRAKDGFEIANYVPEDAWCNAVNAQGATTVNGPLEVRDVAICQATAGTGDESCPDNPAEVAFRTMLVGGLGDGGSNIFGIDVTNFGGFGDEQKVRALDSPFHWDITRDDIPQLGQAISHPAITYVRVGDRRRAAVIVGCGGDPTNGAWANEPTAVGRCVMVLDAHDGSIIREFSHRDDRGLLTEIGYPMRGGVRVAAGEGLAAAERAFIGDQIGRLWRLDLRDVDPSKWTLDVAFPVAGQATDYALGRPVIGRPALHRRTDGKVVVVFGTGAESEDPVNAPEAAFAVSVLDDAVVNNGVITFEAREKWWLRFGPGEQMNAEPTAFSDFAFFTTGKDEANAVCSSTVGRMYGVHVEDTEIDANGAPKEFNLEDGRSGTAKAIIPTYSVDPVTGERVRGDNALAIILPSGRVAYGVQVVRTPACNPGDTATTEVVLNFGELPGGNGVNENGNGGGGNNAGGGGGGGSGAFAEKVGGGVVRPVAIETAGIFNRQGAADFAMCLDCDSHGAGQGAGSDTALFPKVVSYWGSTYAQ
jgi:hypothetical protein